jgi:hypothetical protein
MLLAFLHPPKGALREINVVYDILFLYKVCLVGFHNCGEVWLEVMR